MWWGQLTNQNLVQRCVEVCRDRAGAQRWAEGCTEVHGGAQRCAEVHRGAQKCAEVC